MFYREKYSELKQRIQEKRRFIQVITGPRQVGKTTLARQLMEDLDIPSVYASADGLISEDVYWIETQWEKARFTLRESDHHEVLLILDEVQKIKTWSEVVKRFWDEDSLNNVRIKVLILGSSALLLQKGLSDSLAGRFEMIHLGHWSFKEMKDCFGFSVDQYIYFGGYPGASSLIGDEERWRRYLIDSLIETSISRDILMMRRVDKPALLRQLFHLGCAYSGQILSYQKMLGQLQDAGNTTTLSHYLNLMDKTGLICGLQKFTLRTTKTRGSSPKLQVMNTGLMTALDSRSFSEVRRKPELWGRLVESSIGAHLVNESRGTSISVLYWRDRNREVDFVIQRGVDLVALEVKSGRKKTALPGITDFKKQFHSVKTLLVGAQGISVRELLQMSCGDLF